MSLWTNDKIDQPLIKFNGMLWQIFPLGFPPYQFMYCTYNAITTDFKEVQIRTDSGTRWSWPGSFPLAAVISVCAASRLGEYSGTRSLVVADEVFFLVFFPTLPCSTASLTASRTQNKSKCSLFVGEFFYIDSICIYVLSWTNAAICNIYLIFLIFL